MADLAAGFVGAKPDGLDAIIIDDLRQIAQTLQLERALILQWNTGQSLAVRTHSWLLPGDSLPETFPVAASPYSFGKLEAGEVLAIERLDDLPDPVDRAAYGRNGARSGAVIPLPHDGDSPDITRALAVASTTREFEWTPSTINSLRLFAGMVSQAMARRTSEVALQHALDEANQSRQHSSEAARPRVEVRPQGSTQIVSESAVVRDALSQIEQVAATSATVLLRGETGAGKEVFAQAIHDLSPRRRRQMITVSCAAIPTALIESELFGRERGAYTSALSRQIGRFEAANQSTLFLDEIGDLPAEMQVKLLRVLQERVIERLGSTQSIKVDVRIIAATHRDLEKAVQQGTFREDLFYRLNVFPIVVPALRDRIDDIPGLVWSFIDEFSRAFGKTITSVAPASMKAL
ncbi:MAG TPA: sigma 54-interacting transcriptional regulator, partial [Vicinamibacterales bacterium]